MASLQPVRLLALLFCCLHTALGQAAAEATTVTTTSTPIMKYYNDVVKALPSLSGKCVAITGTTSGIGYWTAVAVARKGAACIVMLNRLSSRAVAAEQAIKKEAGAGVEVVTVTCDLGNLSSVRAAAGGVESVVAKHGGLDVLALNAGIMTQPDLRTMDGYDTTMQTNHLGHFLLSKLLLPSLEAAADARGEGRLVTESSLARSSWHIVEGGGPPNSKYYMKSPAGSLGGNTSSAVAERYHQSKVANLLFAMALHSKLVAAGRSSKLLAVSSAPGFSDTNLNLPKLFQPDWVKHLIGLSAPDGSCPLLTAMFSPSVVSGDFYEPERLLFGPPTKVFAAGVPLAPEYPRQVAGINDKALVTEENLAMVWKASEDGLGIKWDVDNEQSTVVV